MACRWCGDCLAGPLPELVFNIAEGRGIGRCREAWVPAVLEMFGIAYTGSDPLTLAATLDKDCARRLVREAGVAVPAGVLVRGSAADSAEQLDALPMPVIVKPAFEGSSKGISRSSLVSDRAELIEAVERCQEIYRQPVLVEEFIDGDELTVGIAWQCSAGDSRRDARDAAEVRRAVSCTAWM